MYLTRGFIAASTRAFNLPTRAFSLPTRAFEILTRGFELLIRGSELLTRNSCFTFPRETTLIKNSVLIRRQSSLAFYGNLVC